QFSTRSHPQFDTHVQSVRRKRVVPVVVGPKFHRPDRSPEEKELWAKDIVILFKSWRIPSDLKSAHESWIDVAEAMYLDLDSWKKRVIRNMNVLSECRDARD
ncbi:hypothetical protein B0H11DRAFT_1631201, partial [Mycena galericulata]